jgi:type II secretory pathway pseudopilin PulG
LLAIIGISWSPAFAALAAFLALYLMAITAGAIQIGARERRWDLLPPLVASFAIVHWSWGAGVLLNLVTGGRWPSWRPRDAPATAREEQRGFSGAALLLALSCIFVLTMVVPPGLATLVNRARIDRAQRQVAALAAQLGRALEPQGADAALGSAALLGGQGNMPAVPDDSGWATGRVAALDTYMSSTTSADPWGNRYLVNIGVALSRATAEKPSVPGERGSEMPTAMWVLSAGPNGIIETPFNALASSASLGGDDIGARID